MDVEFVSVEKELKFKIKEGWDLAGKKGIYYGSIYDKKCNRSWSVVKFEDADDIELYKFEALKFAETNNNNNHDKQEKLYIVRLYDGFDNVWIDICDPCPYEKAKKIYDSKTDNGTKKIKYNDIDYYKIFESNTRMFYEAK